MKATSTWALLALSGTLVWTNPALSAPLRSGLGGPAGYGELSQRPNDDQSSSVLNLPFEVNFFQNHFSSFYVNNNGNISFGNPLGEYTPQRFPSATQPIIAPFWGDVDTSNQPGGGAVYVASPNRDTVVVTWHNVGYYAGNNDKLNDFQLTLANRSDTGRGNFDIEFRYNRLEWTTGDASDGVGGLGGIAAQAGYDAGNGRNFFVLPGSFSSGILDLANTSNVSQDTPGVWTMAVRNGGTSDGSSPDAPLLPTIVTEDGYQFDFNVQLNQQVFIDPVVAVGYEYQVQSGPNIRTVLLPTLAGDTDGYQIYSLDDGLLASVGPGGFFDFGPDGVRGFRVLGIDAGLNPDDPLAFVTGLTFAGEGPVRMTQNPITLDTDPAGVPEPSALMLMFAGALAAVHARRRAKRAGDQVHG